MATKRALVGERVRQSALATACIPVTMQRGIVIFEKLVRGAGDASPRLAGSAAGCCPF
jgi:hypothetical protein